MTDGTTAKKYPCEKCGEEFDSPQQKGAHKRHHHPKTKGKYSTLKCGHPGCREKFTGPVAARMRGSHRFHVHGIQGTAHSTIWARKRREAAAMKIGPVHETYIKRSANNGSNLSQGNSNEAYAEARAFWISQAARDCEDYAKRVQLSPEDFASRVLAVVSGSSKEIRERYRLSN